MRTNLEAYAQAALVDKLINSDLRADPLVPDNWSQWLLYVRTLQTSLDVVSHDIEAARMQSQRLGVPT